MTTDDFFEKYRPVENTIEARGWGQDGKSQLFETFGPELAWVQAQDGKRVWTLVDTDEGQVLCAGYHHVNRVGYVVTKEPWGDEAECYVDDFDTEDCQ